MSESTFYEDKASCFDLRPSDAKLIEAAKGLGRNLASLSECTEEQRQAITAMLTFLDNLPAPPPPQFNGEFGFSIEPFSVTPETPLSRGWGVYAYRSCLEIGSHYTEAFRDPALDDIDQAFKESAHEFEWFVWLGKPNCNTDFNLAAWIDQVSDPKSLVTDGYRLTIDASVWKVAE